MVDGTHHKLVYGGPEDAKKTAKKP